MSAITRYGGGFLLGVFGLYAIAVATLDPLPPIPTPEPSAPIRASVAQIWQAYSDNEVAAEAVWGGRTVELRATVASVGRGPLGGVVVLLRSPGALEARAAGLDEAEALDLAPGQRVTLYCDVRGVSWTSLMLERCRR